MTNYDFVTTEDNIIYKVAFFLKQKYGVSSGVRIELNKKIPVAAGLGGGSSNAAQTIIGLSRLWKLNLSESEMHDIAGKFGSDINFFLSGGTATGENRGELITKIDDLEINNILLVNPQFGISSRQAYKAVDIGSSRSNNWKKILTDFNIKYCQNALQKGVCNLFPDLGKLIDQIGEMGASKVILSGSGPTIIGFCHDKITANRIAEYFSEKGYWSYVTKTMKRSTR